jgi:hypothetical protein
MNVHWLSNSTVRSPVQHLVCENVHPWSPFLSNVPVLLLGGEGNRRWCRRLCVVSSETARRSRREAGRLDSVGSLSLVERKVLFVSGIKK